RKEESAFEALVRRHGPMVLGVCRRILHNAQDAEDAFQATFLVLLRKAPSIARREVLGSWLYTVAYRTATRARALRHRRRAKGRGEGEGATPQAPGESPWGELAPLLDREVSRLPDRYRGPLVLCHLQGKSRQDVARQLGLPAGTVSSRLARGRQMLRKRLARQGVALSTGALAALLSEGAALAALPGPLVAGTGRAPPGPPAGPGGGAGPP